MKHTLLFALFFTTLTHAASASAQERAPHVQVGVGFQLGVAGSVDDDFGLDPSFGFQVQGHHPLGRFLLLGGALAYRSMKVEDLDDRFGLFTVGVSVGAHYAIDLGSMQLDPYALFNIGLGVAGSSGDFDSETGIDFGLKVGANLWVTDLIAPYLALGYQQTTVFPEPENVGYGQLIIELGAAARF
ncbi:MAG: outer membrane beta-barrel protein [Myxococcota bacterium]